MFPPHLELNVLNTDHHYALFKDTVQSLTFKTGNLHIFINTLFPSMIYHRTLNTQWQTLFSWASKSLQMATEAMKLKDAYSLVEKLWKT